MTATDGLDQALVNAGLDLLRADPALTVHDGYLPAGAHPPYVLVYSYITRPEVDPDRALNGLSGVWVVRWVLHNVGGGLDASAARAVAQRCRTALLDKRPTIPGLSCGRIRLEDAQPPQRDETAGLVMDAVTVYKLRATTDIA